MFSLFHDLIKSFKKKNVCIDNNIFMLHYRVTVIVLISFSITLTAKQAVGKPITCLSDSPKMPDDVINHYCWVTATFTIFAQHTGRSSPMINQYNHKIIPDVLHNNYGPAKYHNFYMWVCFIFLLQAVCFYLPRFLWQIYEGGLMKTMSTGLNSINSSSEETIKQIDVIKGFFLQKYHQRYILTFVICEILNLVNVISQIFLIDYVVDGEFRNYGWKMFHVIQLDFIDRSDPLTNIFPIISKCTFYLTGPSGTIQSRDALCVLPLNVINEKFFIILWLWFLLLAVLTACNLLNQLLFMCSKRMRYFMLRARIPTRRNIVRRLSYDLNLGDWFVLYQLSKNVYIGFFQEFMDSLIEKIDEKFRPLENSFITSTVDVDQKKSNVNSVTRITPSTEKLRKSNRSPLLGISTVPFVQNV